MILRLPQLLNETILRLQLRSHAPRDSARRTRSLPRPSAAPRTVAGASQVSCTGGPVVLHVKHQRTIKEPSKKHIINGSPWFTINHESLSMVINHY